MMSKVKRSSVWMGMVFASMCAALLAPLCAVAVQIDASQFARTFNITFPGYSGSETLTDFPVLIKLSPALNDFKYDKCNVANGGDLRFADSDGNLLSSEIDTWDENGTSLVWVKVPSLNSSTLIRAYYGYKGASDPPAVTASDVWSNGFLGVWHLNEETSPLADATGGGKNATRSSKYTECVALGEAGAVGKSVGFDKVTEGDDAHSGRVEISDSGNKFTGMAKMTLELWVYQREWVGGRRLLYRKNGSVRAHDFLLNGENVNGQQSIAFTFGTTNTAEEVAQVDLNPYHYFYPEALNKWRHYALVYDSVDAKKLVNYVNGSAGQSKTATQDYVVLPNGGSIYLGNLGGSQAFPGNIDEFRISSAARSADWVKATHDTVANEDFTYYELSNDWLKYARKMTITFAGAPETALTDFPVLVKLSERDETAGTGIKGFSYADFAKGNGGDLRFSDADGNMLDCEVETWDENGESLVWVKVPTLQKDTEITAYYGWEWAPSVKARNVWSNGYIGVWHLDESGMTMYDATQTGVDFTCDAGYADIVGRGVEGLVGNAAEFDMVTEGDNAHKGHLYLKDSNHRYCGRSTMTIEYWVYQRQAAHNRRLMYCKTGNDRAYDIYSQTSSAGFDKITVTFGTTNTTTSASANPSLTVNSSNAYFETWKYHSIVFDSEVAQNFTLYFDGEAKGSKSVGENDIMLPIVKDLRLGNLGSNQAYPGKFDEMRISGVARSEAWLKATYDTIADSANFTTYGVVKNNGLTGFMVIIR